MTDEEAKELLRLLDKYAQDYNEDPRHLTVSDLIDDLLESTR